MDPKLIFEMTKKEMIQTLESSTYEDIISKKELFFTYFSFLESFQQLNELRIKHIPTNEEQVVEIGVSSKEGENEEIDATEEMDATTISTYSPDVLEKRDNFVPVMSTHVPTNETEERFPAKQMYRFERKIRGGYIAEIDGFVPEGIVRRLDLRHGDFVYATEVDPGFHQRKKFIYELAKRTEKNESIDRVQVNHCPVERDGNMYVVRRSLETGHFIRIDEVPHTVLLSDEDVREFKLAEGDIIDIAFPTGRPDFAKVLWLHESERMEITNVNRQIKKKEKKNDESTEDEVFEQTLEGKTILIIGDEPHKAEHRENIEKRGGTFLWADCDESFVRYEPLVRKADLVICLLKVSAHMGAKMVKKLCKDHNVPFETTFSLGKETIARLAQEAIPND